MTLFARQLELCVSHKICLNVCSHIYLGVIERIINKHEDWDQGESQKTTRKNWYEDSYCKLSVTFIVLDFGIGNISSNPGQD